MICETTITLIEKPEAMDKYGAAKFVPVATNIDCHARFAKRRIRTAQGKEVVTAATLYIFDSDVEIDEGYRVTIEGEQLVIIEARPATHDTLRHKVCFAAPA